MSRELVLLSRPGCHLCHEMRRVVERVLAQRGLGFTLVERDVRDDPEWRRQYLTEIPVLLLAGREVLRHRVTEEALGQRLLAMAASEPSPS